MGRYVISCNTKKSFVPASTILKVLDTHTDHIQYFSKSDLTRGYPIQYNQELCDALFDIDDNFFIRFPIAFRTDKMTEQMIKKYYAKFYEYYLIKHRRVDMSREYIRHRYNHLLYVPMDQIDQEMCDMFFLANPGSLNEIPDEYMRDEYIDFIYNKYCHLAMIPLEYRTLEICIRFIKGWSKNIQFVPDELLPQVCHELGIDYSRSSYLDNDYSWMNQRRIDRNGDEFIKIYSKKNYENIRIPKK